MSRTWGFWTRFKLEILHDYLDAFTTASKAKSSEFVYLDAFAGEGHGVDRLTGEEFPGSATIALDTANAAFTRLRFFEQGPPAAALRDQLARDHPHRDAQVYEGDCNETIPTALEDLAELQWAPTFAFIDPDGMELRWSTLGALARHKEGVSSRGTPRTKVELWMLFNSGGLLRTLALEEGVPPEVDAARATRLFGTDRWQAIYDARVGGEIEGRQAREEYVNLVRWRLEKDLGYQSTHALEIRNERGVPHYHMVFATDHEAGDRIMRHLYGTAAERFEAMRREALDLRRGQMALDIDVDTVPVRDLYRPEPPHEPRG